jgi:hypothetical protein
LSAAGWVPHRRVGSRSVGKRPHATVALAHDAVVGAVRIDVGAGHLAAVVDGEDRRARRAWQVDRPEVAVVPQEAVQRAARVGADAHDLAPVVDPQRSGHEGTREDDVDEPSARRAQEAGRRRTLVVVVEADRVAAVVDVDVLVEVAAAGWILQPLKRRLRSRTKWRTTRRGPLRRPARRRDRLSRWSRSPHAPAVRRAPWWRGGDRSDQDGTLREEAMARGACRRRRWVSGRRREQDEGEQRQRHRDDGGER